MSSTTTTTTTTTTRRRSMERRTYWCHDCDMSISLIPPTSPSDIFTCPHCTSDFLEELDSPITFSNHSHDVYFHNIINQLFNSNLPTIPVPTPTASIESIVTLKVTCEMMEMDKDGMCAVCKEVFLVGDELKVLPCKHLYHGECILPWLSLRNSCPVCRFQLPVEPCADGEMKARRRSRSRVLRFADFMDHDIDDEEGQEQELFGFGLRNFSRRHRFVFPTRRSQFRTDVEGDGEEEGVFSPTQIGEEGGVSGRTDSVETVSSWPNWPVDIDVVENTNVDDVGMSS